MTEYYENGPEGMPRVEHMTRSTIMAVLSQKNVPTIYVSREEDYNSLCKFAHAVAEETLARVPAWPTERTTAPVSVTDAQIREIFLANGFTIKEGQTDLKPYVYAAARALLAAAPSPQARVDAMNEGLTAWRSEYRDAYLYQKSRAETVESRLAEIQRGVEGLRRWRDEELCYGKPEIAMLERGVGEYLKRCEVLALLQPQGQADTSGLPG